MVMVSSLENQNAFWFKIRACLAASSVLQKERNGCFDAVVTAIQTLQLRSGIVEDKVGHLLCRNLCSIGWAVSRIFVVQNDIDSVAEEVERWKGTSDMVFIYGGVGPLHSDVTVSRVAKAFGVRTEFNTKNKLLITGTPLENSVKELWMNINWSEIEIAFMGKLFILLQ